MDGDSFGRTRGIDGLSNLQFDLGLRRFLNSCLCLFKEIVECFLGSSSVINIRPTGLELTNLQFLGQIMNFTPLFVVKECVCPQKLCPLRKGVPAFEVADTRGIAAPLNTKNFLLQFFQRQGIVNDTIVIPE